MAAAIETNPKGGGNLEAAERLACEDLVAGYTTDIDILRGLSVRAWDGRVSCIVGPNGTGKSTLLKTLFGFLRPRAGRVLLGGRDITGRPPHELLGLGVAYLPQRPSLFPHLTVESNLKLGLWHARTSKADMGTKLDAAYERFPVIRAKRLQPAGQLSGGQQRQVEIARSLMAAPGVYLIDEPTAGIDPQTSETIYDIVHGLAHNHRKAVLLVDQDIRAALAITDYVYVVKNGAVFSEGVRESYGGDTDALVARWLYASGELSLAQALSQEPVLLVNTCPRAGTRSNDSNGLAPPLKVPNRPLLARRENARESHAR